MEKKIYKKDIPIQVWWQYLNMKEIELLRELNAESVEFTEFNHIDPHITYKVKEPQKMIEVIKESQVFAGGEKHKMTTTYEVPAKPATNTSIDDDNSSSKCTINQAFMRRGQDLLDVKNRPNFNPTNKDLGEEDEYDPNPSDAFTDLKEHSDWSRRIEISHLIDRYFNDFNRT